MKCVLCNQRKGKRSCPAKSALLCAQCCGEKRILEIDCPEACEYLKVGRNHEVHTQRSRHLYTADPVKLEKRRRVFTQFENFVARLEMFFGEERRSSRDMTDAALAAALDLVLATLRTEENGILYERVSSDLRVEPLRRRVKEFIHQHLNPPEGGGERMRRIDAIDCLEVVRDILASHMEAGPSGLAYVDFLARLMPRAERTQDSPSSLILPGR